MQGIFDIPIEFSIIAREKKKSRGKEFYINAKYRNSCSLSFPVSRSTNFLATRGKPLRMLEVYTLLLADLLSINRERN